MEHVEFPILIKSSTDGVRLREQIRQEREQLKRQHTELVAEVKATLREADEILTRVARQESWLPTARIRH